MQKIIIADASCLILFHKIFEINLLHSLFGEIIISSVIAKEFGELLPEWIIIIDPTDKKYEQMLNSFVDAGEASAIALAIEYKNCLLIVDDMKARKLATELSIKYTGSLGVIVDAKFQGHIELIKPIIEKMSSKTVVAVVFIFIFFFRFK